MFYRVWPVFAQAVAAALAVLLVVAPFAPGFLFWRAEVLTASETPAPDAAGGMPITFRAAAKKAMPAVVNIYTSKEARRQLPPIEDPPLRRFFGEPYQGAPVRQISLGSGVIVSAEGYILTNTTWLRLPRRSPWCSRSANSSGWGRRHFRDRERQGPKPPPHQHL